MQTEEATRPKPLKSGQKITIWPIIDRASGMSYDTEGGAQPWAAKYRGTTIVDDEVFILIQRGDEPVRKMPVRCLTSS